jgi:hypothetical protein
VDDSLHKYNVRLAAKGSAQKEGVDYEETFSLTAKLATTKLILAREAQFGWKLYQMNIKSAFLNRDLEEEVYMYQP